MPKQALAVALSVVAAGLGGACASVGRLGPLHPDAARQRVSILARSAIWHRVPTKSLDIKAGPRGAGAFPPGSRVDCDYVDRQLGGKSQKFVCRIGKGDEVKVKFGAANGEVFGEVLATRLLWALGFGADRMYPVSVVCRGCPAALGGIAGPANTRRFDPAVIERPAHGSEWPADDPPGWAWNELNIVNPRLGGATLAQRDALKLLAVFLQHTDSKAEQQRILCQGAQSSRPGTCRRPFLMVSDVGLTFGRANRPNANDVGSVNLMAWRQAKVWKDDTGCRGNLPRSLTGTLDDPLISEDGRQFLAGLLRQLSDRQLRELFEVARVELRPRSPDDVSSGYPAVGEWVEAFKQKRAEIMSRRCHASESTRAGERRPSELRH